MLVLDMIENIKSRLESRKVRKKSLERGKNSYNPSNQKKGAHQKSSSTSLEVQNKQGKTEISIEE